MSTVARRAVVTGAKLPVRSSSENGQRGYRNFMRKAFYLSLAFLFLVPFISLWEGVPSLQGGTIKGTSLFKSAIGSVSGASIPDSRYLPVLDTDFSDLDARDAQNRPTKTVETQQVLETLFIENLFNLAVVEPSHAMRQITADAMTFSALFKELFFTSVGALIKPVLEGICSSKNRFVHNGDSLWITISVGVLLALPLACRFLKTCAISCLILRC